MKKILLTIITGCTVTGVLCLVFRTTFPEYFWIWIVGLAGPLVGCCKFVTREAHKFLSDEDSADSQLKTKS